MLKRGNHMSVPMTGDRRGDPRARQVSALMEKYSTQTAKMRTGEEQKASQLPPGVAEAVILRAASPEWIFAKAWRHMVRCSHFTRTLRSVGHV